MKQSDVSLETETTLHIAEHEILLRFRSDEYAEYFHYWWNEAGAKAFVKYVNANEGGQEGSST